MAREYGTSVETSAAPEKVWRIWSDMSTWGEWNPNVETMDWSGGFVSGSTWKLRRKVRPKNRSSLGSGEKPMNDFGRSVSKKRSMYSIGLMG